MSESCSNCQFSFGLKMEGQPDTLVCRRNPPTPHMMMQRGQPTPARPDGVSIITQSIPPPVQPDWWCGEFKIKAVSL